MYLAHIIFLTGLALLSRSRLAWALALGVALWFNHRVEDDERRLDELFGDRYRAYKARVPRWLPLPSGMG
jgi:protein-S-isoprenylcysteine O-methyltransferase Ste14